jgi:hypothetical protein
MSRSLPLAVPLLAALIAGGCYDFHLDGPEDPPPLQTPRLVSVAIQYRQPAACLNLTERCPDNVAFFGSWMQPGAEFFLERTGDGYLWTGVARSVPVNFPPRDDPYRVRVFDPHLQLSLTEGFTAERLAVGGEAITRIEGEGGRNEAGLVFIDATGQGRNPY